MASLRTIVQRQNGIASGEVPKNLANAAQNKAMLASGKVDPKMWHGIGQKERDALLNGSPDAFRSTFGLGGSGGASGAGTGAGSGGSGTSGDDLLKAYQSALIGGGNNGADDIATLEKTYALDAKRLKQEHDLGMASQQKSTDIAVDARAKEKRQDEDIRRQAVNADRGAAMSAYKNL